MIDIASVIALAILTLNFCMIIHSLVGYINECIEKKHEENRITDYIFARCRELGGQEEELLSKRGVINVPEFNKIDAKIDVLLELMKEINKEEEEA